MAILSLTACDSDKIELDDSNLIINNLQYFKDKRTNLCFAGYNLHYAVNMTNVTCTPEVEKLIK